LDEDVKKVLKEYIEEADSKEFDRNEIESEEENSSQILKRVNKEEKVTERADIEINP
jgi:hypothetical protein